MTGTVENIDLTTNTFEVESKVFTAAPINAVGPDLAELEEGEQVTVFFSDAGSGQPINAVTITRE